MVGKKNVPTAQPGCYIQAMQTLMCNEIPPPLASGEVHLWWYPSPAVAPRTRRVYIDALLRISLARYVGTTPQSLRFARETRGRPWLIDAAMPLDFNLSDTDRGTIIAVARDLRIGVDIERLDRQPRVMALAQRYFRPEETAGLSELPSDQAQHAFLNAWTAKESSCKATGTGIYGWLDQWGFARDIGGADPQVTYVPEAAAPLTAWQHRRVSPADGYTAVIAVKGVLGDIKLFASDAAHAVAAWAHRRGQSA